MLQFHGGPTYGIESTGTGPVLINGTSLGRDKGAGPVFIPAHPEDDPGKTCVEIYFCVRIFPQKVRGRQTQPSFQAQNVIGRQDQIEIRTATGKTVNALVAAEMECLFGKGPKFGILFICVHTADAFRRFQVSVFGAASGRRIGQFDQERNS